MALDPCVKNILCSLSSSALRSIQTLISGQLAILDSQIVTIQTQVLQYKLLLTPLEASVATAQAIVDEVKESAYLIPLNKIAECADLGDFTKGLQQSINTSVSQANDLLFEYTRLDGYINELNSKIDNLNKTKDQFNQIYNIINDCLGGQ